MTTALELMQNVFRRANMETELTSFSTSQPFPYDVALDVLNRAINDLNSRGRYRFMMTSTALAYSSGVYSYTMSTLGIDSEGIDNIERQLTGYGGHLKSMSLPSFRGTYRRADIATAMPTAWTDYGDILELNTKPDQDYSIVVWHMPTITEKANTTDVIEIPNQHEHVLKNMAYAWLLEALGRQDFDKMYALAVRNALQMKANDKALKSRPARMPRAF